MEKFDVVVIGAGPGGYPAAIRAAQLGARVALVEKEQLGGVCLNCGCIPTKTLIAASHLNWSLRNEAPALGIHADNVSVDYAALQRHKNDVIGKLRGGIAQLLKANNVALFNGTASLESRNRVQIAGDKSQAAVIEAGRIIFATGSVSSMPGFLPKSPRVLESRAFLELEKLPASLLVLGGGIIGCELACMAARLGTAVTVVEMLPDILAFADPDVRREVRRTMEKDMNITVLTGHALENIRAGSTGVSGEFDGRRLEAETLLAAVGRKPFTEGLGLENAGLRVDARGFLATDDSCRTRVASIFAVGDLAGREQLAHVATAMGLVAAENACGRRSSMSGRVVPSAVFTAPEIGTVGLGEEQAKQQNREIVFGKFPFAAVGRALASGETAGFVKWIADANTDQLLGAQVVGPHATDILATAALAVQGEWTAAEFGRVVHAHPTFAEAWMEAAHAVHGLCINAPPPRKPKKA